MQEMLIHYDVTEHYVSLDTFLNTALSAQRAVEALNDIMFDGQLDFEVIVLAPEPGSLKQILGIIVKTTGAAYAALAAGIYMMDSPSVQEISKELLGKKPSDFIVEAIQSRDALEDDENRSIVNEDQATKLESLIAEATVAVLECQRSDIERLSIDDVAKFDLARAQSDFFLAIIDDPAVRAVGFTDDHDFPIDRSHFVERAIRPRPVNEDEGKEEKWMIETLSVRITSPNFERNEQSTRKWKGRTSKGAAVLFEISDAEFWQRLNAKEFKFDDSTEMLLQFAVSRTTKERRAVRVLQINELKLAEPLDDNALTAILGAIASYASERDQYDLFSSRP